MSNVAILVRKDSQNNPLVFLAYSVERDTIKVWTEAQGEVTTTIEYYGTTKPLSSADEQVMKLRYAAATGNNDITIMHRLPRKSRVIPSLLGGAPVPTQAPAGMPVINGAPAPQEPAKSKRKQAPAAPSGPIDVTAALAGAKAKYDLEVASILEQAKKQAEQPATGPSIPVAA